jgi:hypothetical protein
MTMRTLPSPEPDAENRARCAAMARWLEAASTLGALALCCTVVAALGTLAHAWRDTALGFALLALASTPVERYLALRIRLDAGLFADLASARIDDLAALDAGLSALGVGKSGPSLRTLDDRLEGARRLWRRYALVVGLQATSVAIAVAFA